MPWRCAPVVVLRSGVVFLRCRFAAWRCAPVLFCALVVDLWPGVVFPRWLFCGLPQHTDIPSVPQEGRGHAPGGAENASRTTGGVFWYRISLPYRRSLFFTPSSSENTSRTTGALLRYRASILYRRSHFPVPNFQTDTRCIVWWLLRRAIR